MEFRELVLKRRMVRKFDPRPISRELLMHVLEVARHAPSAGFSQGFDFIVLDRPSQVEWFIKTTEHPKFPNEHAEFEHPPACIVIPISNQPAYLERYSLPDKERFGLQQAEAWPVPWWDVDTGMAIMLILLAAIEEGLGGWLWGIFWGEQDVLRELGVPEGCRPVGVIGLGYPLGGVDFDRTRFTNRRRALESMVHFGSWGG
ncbi:MAG TPA: nitroreductase family protein [Candidatus Dormibacteraeota bacterium]|nr:nitroreductase family protein [Candidatus Dormibacteraeota bacterium]